MIERVEYFKGLDKEILFDIMFSLTPITFEQGSVMLTNEQTVNSVFFIENGVVETYTTFEGNEFVLEQLYRGSVINHQAFFMQDCMYVDVRC
jgi:CRP-like cAMP-binding protein